MLDCEFDFWLVCIHVHCNRLSLEVWYIMRSLLLVTIHTCICFLAACLAHRDVRCSGVPGLFPTTTPCCNQGRGSLRNTMSRQRASELQQQSLMCQEAHYMIESQTEFNLDLTVDQKGTCQTLKKQSSCSFS